MLPLSLDMKKPAMENALSLGTEVGEMFIKTFLQTLRPDKVKERDGYFCDFKWMSFSQLEQEGKARNCPSKFFFGLQDY